MICRLPAQTLDGWRHSPASGAPWYYWQPYGGYILDRKTVQDNAAYESVPNDTFDDFFQQNRMTVNVCDGTTQIIYFPEHHFEKIKTGTQTFQLYETGLQATIALHQSICDLFASDPAASATRAAEFREWLAPGAAYRCVGYCGSVESVVANDNATPLFISGRDVPPKTRRALGRNGQFQSEAKGAMRASPELTHCASGQLYCWSQ